MSTSNAATGNEHLRITVWWCNECGYWRKEQTTGIHAAVNPRDRNGRFLSHPLRPVTFEMVKP